MNNHDFPYKEGLIGSQYFYENTVDHQACSLLDTYIDFGGCSRYRVIESRTIRVRNNTYGRMSCVWIHPGDNPEEECPFIITPRVADISPRSFTEFKVNFRPMADNSFYGSQFECFVYFKSMRNFRLVTEETFTPPWCLTPTIAGYIFYSN